MRGDKAVLAVAAALANATGARRGLPAIENVLDLLPADLRANYIDEARAAIEAYQRASGEQR